MKFIASSAILTLLVGCGSSSGPAADTTIENTDHTVSQKSETNSKILSNGQAMSLIPKQATGDGDYYLAPSVQFAKIGMGNHVTEMTYIDENGDNHYGMENIFKTELKVMPLDIHYNSSNARDNYADIGHWRTSFSSRMDFTINEGDIKDKSNFYDTPRDACESGFNDIKESAYRGILKDANSVYDKDHDMCVLKQDGKDIGKFIVWNRSQKREDVHYIETATQEFLTFVKNDEGKFISEQSGIVLELAQEENGAFSYKDAQDILRRYNSDGKLVYIMNEGQEAHLTYDANGKLDKVTGALDNVIDFNYNEDGLVSEINAYAGLLKVSLNYHDNKLLRDLDMVFFDENKTALNVFSKKFDYNSKRLLSSVQDINETGSIISNSFKYDLLNQVTYKDHDDGVEEHIYDGKLISVHKDGDTTNLEISFSNTKQVVKTVKSQDRVTEYEFNKDGRMSKIVLEEKQDTNSTNHIQKNSFSDKTSLTIEISYNQRGLIKSQYLETSDGMKKFTNFEYKTKYNEPTKIITNDEVAFFDFNNKGQLIKMSHLKYDKDMKVKPHALNDIKLEPEYYEENFKYSESGLLQKISNNKDDKTLNFSVEQDGRLVKGNIKKHGWYSRWKARWKRRIAEMHRIATTKGLANGVIYDIKSNDTKTAFVSGAGGKSIKNLYNYNEYNNHANAEHFKHNIIACNSNCWNLADVFNKASHDKLIVIGHSYGGDSSLKAIKKSSLKKKVDLFITLDPVGRFVHNMHVVGQNTHFWINVHASVKWYNRSKWDWTAETGGKYGKNVPADLKVRVKCHHDQVSKMIRELQTKYGVNYDFNIKTAY